MSLIIQALFAIFLTIPVSSQAAESPREWTLFMYVAGDEPEIEIPSNAMIRQWEAVQSLVPGSKVSVIVQHDDVGKDPNYRYDIQYVAHPSSNKKPDTRPIPVKDIQKIDPNFRYEERDSSNPVTLKQFLKWGIEAYPAKHYALFLLGHSWGQQGALQDFFKDGKDLEVSSMVKNYELRRVMEEVYREKKIEKFDLLVMDVCIQGQLDTALEYQKVFRYFAGSPIETPLYSIPYTQVLEPFVHEVDNTNHTSDSAVENLLKGLVTDYVKSHSRGGSLVSAENSMDPVSMSAIRMDKLPRVAEALKEVVKNLPTSLKSSWKKGELKNLERLKDMDTNADLLLLAKVFGAYAERYMQDSDPLKRNLVASAKELETSLGYNVENPSLVQTSIKHPKAVGAWASIQVDEALSSPELSTCVALKSAVLMNRFHKEFLPTMVDKKNKNIDWYDFDCYETAKEYEHEHPSELHGPLKKPKAMNGYFDLKLKWPYKVPGYIEEKDGVRTLSLYFKKKENGLNVKPYLRLAGSTQIEVQYISGKPEEYIVKKDASLLLDTQEEHFPDSIYNTDDKKFEIEGKPGLYIAEAHSHGTVFKQGLGIFLRNKILSAEEEPNFGGRVPIEKVEPAPYAMSLEEYMDHLKALGELDLQKVRGEEFYRLHRISETLWPDFLF